MTQDSDSQVDSLDQREIRTDFDKSREFLSPLLQFRIASSHQIISNPGRELNQEMDRLIQKKMKDAGSARVEIGVCLVLPRPD